MSVVWKDPDGTIRIKGYPEIWGLMLKYLYLDGKARNPSEETEYQAMRTKLEGLFT